MKKRALLIVMVAAVMLLTTAVAAFAKKPPEAPKPTTTTTTETPPEFWTCEARIDNGDGAIWSPGVWNGSAYVADIASCTDILPEHLGEPSWTVAWNGITQKGTVRGLKLVFEEEVHSNVFAEQIFTTETGFWCPTLPSGIDNLVFVAMPHNGDKWVSFEVTVVPGRQEPCG
jgi:hypothetical protein